MIIFLEFAVLSSVFFFYYRSTSAQNRPLLLVMFISTFYYGVAGPLYWIYVNDGYFLDVFWGDKIIYAASLIVAYSILYGFFVSFRFRRSPSVAIVPLRPTSTGFWAMFGLAAISIAYVFVNGVALGGLNRSDPFILVFYQFSDMCIPILLYSIARKRFSTFNVVCLLVFSLYAIAVGFRYKLVLLYFPIILLLLGGEVKNARQLRQRVVGIGIALLVLSVFSVMTLTRKKFSGVDLSALSGVGSDVALYGLFAESNIIFGLLGVLSEFVDKHHYIFFEPIFDSVLELIPKFFLAGRSTGNYLMVGANGLISDQAINSGTAYPYFGEFLSMGGHLAAVVGVYVYACLYHRYSSLSRVAGAVNKDFITVGLGVLAVFFGYYNFSRGYLPQSVKGFIFVVLPYFYLISRHYRRVRLVNSDNLL